MMFVVNYSLSVLLPLALFTSRVVAKDVVSDQEDVDVNPEERTRTTCSIEHRKEYPIFCHMMDRLLSDDQTLAEEIHDWASKHHLLVGENLDFSRNRILNRESSTSTSTTMTSTLPLVFAHGMGDSCFNSGMIHIGEHTSELLGGVYVTCIPTGDTQSEDTTNGYFLNMDASVDVFAMKIANDSKLSDGFHAIGFSQGNNVIRGYIERYNNPPVDTFLSVNGVNAGIGAVPYCQPQNQEQNQLDEYNNNNNNDDVKTMDSDGVPIKFSMCDLLMEQASRRAYSTWIQEHSFQANYWRDPRPVEREMYEEYSQLARWNNEGQYNQTFKDNFGKTKQFVWIKANQDGMVWPNEGEHWGAPDPNNPFHHILPMNETEWYIQDLFGLKTAQEQGKNYFEEFDGDHLQFTMEDFDRWIQTYIMATTDITTTDTVVGNTNNNAQQEQQSDDVVVLAET